MNAAHLHLVITHAPVTIVAIGMLLLVLAIIRGSDELKRSALLLFALAAVIAVIAYVTGQPATQQLKATVGAMPMDEIDRHAEIAVVALSVIVADGVFAAVMLVWKRKKQLGIGITVAALVFALVVAILLAWTAQLGADIRHPELRTSSSGRLANQGRATSSNNACS